MINGSGPAAKSVTFEPAFRLDLDHQRKRAKELHKAYLSGDETARARYRCHHPTLAKDNVQANARLSDAQLVIAREVGLPSWPKLKAHVAEMREMEDRITRGTEAPDRDMATLHIRCGSDIQTRLTEAGFVGDFLEYSDALCQGPMTDDPSWLDHRAAFLAGSYGNGTGPTVQQIRARLAQAETILASAASRHARVVLWFEHDSFDQINLARCLAQFAETPPSRLEMVTLDHYPGAMRFIGLGQLPPEALRLLWDKRTIVTQPQVQAGRTVWSLLRLSDPSALAAAANQGMAALPYLARAVHRHCQEFPWITDGLGLTERLVLRLVADRPRTIGEIFRDLMLNYEPLPWLGDRMLQSIVEAMKCVTQPAFTAAFNSNDRRWFREELTITPLGRSVLAGEVDWLSLSPPERWLGGVRITAAEPCWRWDERRGRFALH